MALSRFPASELSKAAPSRLAPVDVLLDVGCGIRPQALVVPQLSGAQGLARPEDLLQEAARTC